jgi:DNA-binding NtrC family response regulator
VLRFDRYLAWQSRTLDLASGRLVEIERVTRTADATALFDIVRGRTLIDVDIDQQTQIEIWDRHAPRVGRGDVTQVTHTFVELLEGARLAAPRAFELPHDSMARHDRLWLMLAREARVRGWVPVALEVLTAFASLRGYRAPRFLADRSLAIFVRQAQISKDELLALLKIAQRDVRPHVLVRARGRSDRRSFSPLNARGQVAVHETLAQLAPSVGETQGGAAGPQEEAVARWRRLLDGSREAPEPALALAQVLVGRDQLFEARALAESARARGGSWQTRADAIVAQINAIAGGRRKGWDMVDDCVDVLALCQDTEDERVALSRVSAFLCERLQASSVAFVARDGASPRVLSRVGSSSAAVDLALRAMDTGVAVAPGAEGPSESASPVRHATEVIGALWCRWGAGMPIAAQQATTLLGVAAAAAAPSVRLMLSRLAPPGRAQNPVPELVGESAAMVAVRDAIVRAAQSPFPVLIEGESGSGKELAARAIHARSGRRERRFCAINCAALVDDLVEAELFGHARGAFTGAHAERAGLFEDANGGSLFMDEVAELSLRVQAKLLRVLQENEVRRLGETVMRKIDARIVAATNRPLAKEVASGTFRADLWYRLDVVRIQLPPLRERLEDLPLLVRHLWQSLAPRVGTRAVLSPAAIGALAAYPWPGNIRELQNVLASMLVSAPRAGLIGSSSLPAHIARVAASERDATLAAARRQFEERYVRAALARAGGRTKHAARDLGVSRQGLMKLMGRLGIQ